MDIKFQNKLITDKGMGQDNISVTRYFGISNIEDFKNKKQYCVAFLAAQLRIERILLNKILPMAFDSDIVQMEMVRDIHINDLKESIDQNKLSKSEKEIKMVEWAKRFLNKDCYFEAKKFIKNYLNKKPYFFQLRELCYKLGIISDSENTDLKIFYNIRNKIIHQHSYLVNAYIDFPEGKKTEEEIKKAIDKAINFIKTYEE